MWGWGECEGKNPFFSTKVDVHYSIDLINLIASSKLSQFHATFIYFLATNKTCNHEQSVK